MNNVSTAQGLDELASTLMFASAAGDVETMLRILDPKVRWHLPQSVSRYGLDVTVEGSEAYVRMVQWSRSTNYKTIAFDVQQIVVTGTVVAALARLRGVTHKDRAYDNQYGFFLKFETARVVEGWELADTAYAAEIFA